MPTYEYRCEACGHRFEKFQSMTALPMTACPECGGAVRRLIGAGAGFILKGAGFHRNDYSSAASCAGAGAGGACDRSRPCCGRDSPCERSPRNA
jgi:putative FmdB family regulatory protein